MHEDRSTHHVVLLAVDLAVDVVEVLAAERPAAGAADEALGVVQLVHGLARVPRPAHLLLARHALACGGAKRRLNKGPTLWGCVLDAQFI